MIGPDSLLRFAFRGIPVRGAIVQLGPSWEAVRTRNADATPAHGLLGEACAASALMFGNIRLDGQISLQLQGPGPLRLLLAQCTSRGKLRAILRANPDAGALTEDFPTLTAGATLAITIEKQVPGQQRYQGIVPLEGHTLADALEGYFLQSEQLPSRIWLMADGHASCGLLLQRMPGELEDEDDWNRIVQLAQTITPGEMLGLPAEEILHRLYHREPIELFEPMAISFECPCDRDRVAEVLRSLGQEEINAAVAELGELEVCCEFCNEKYHFDKVDLGQIFSEVAPAAGPRTRQ